MLAEPLVTELSRRRFHPLRLAFKHDNYFTARSSCARLPDGEARAVVRLVHLYRTLGCKMSPTGQAAGGL